MKVLIIGANGNTGYRVARRLASSKHNPVAMIRDAGQRERFDELGVPTVLGDLEYPIDHAVRGCDAVIFAAGSGGSTGKDKTVLIDHLGGIRAAVTALEQGAERFVMLSGLNATIDANTAIPHWHRAKAWADRFIRELPDVMEGRGLAWTIVCPGGLHDGDEGGVEIDSSSITGEGRTSRESLAAVLAGCLDCPGSVGQQFALVDGPTPAPQALAAAFG